MSRRCAVCGEDEGASVVFCKACEMAHHRDCWDYLGSCSRFGCGCREFKDAATHAVSGPLIIDRVDGDGPLSSRFPGFASSPRVVLGSIDAPMEVAKLVAVFSQHQVPFQVEYLNRAAMHGSCARIHVPYVVYREARALAIEQGIRVDFQAMSARPPLVNYPVSLAASLFMALLLPAFLPVWICCVLVSVCGRDIAHIFTGMMKR